MRIDAGVVEAHRQCRCGPVARPVMPTVPSRSPRASRWPLCTRISASRWQYMVINLAVVDEHGAAVEIIVAGINHVPAAKFTGAPVGAAM